MEITGDGIKGFLETKMASGLGVVVLGQELGAKATGVRDAESAGAFGFNVEKVVVEGIAGDGVEVTEFVVDGGEVGAREVSLGVAMVGRWQELDVGHGGIDLLKGIVVGAAGEGIGNTVAFVGGVANGEGKLGKEVEPAGLARGDVFLEFLVAENGENLAEMIKVGLEGGAKNKDVVEVDHDTDFEEVAKDVVHGGLECGEGIGETERHYEKLVVPEAGADGGFVGVLLADTNLVESTTKVDLGEVFGSTEAIKKFGYPGNRILVLDRDPIQGAVVRAHAEFRGAVLRDEETDGTEGGGARLNESFFKEFIELALHFLGLGDGELSSPADELLMPGHGYKGRGDSVQVEEGPEAAMEKEEVDVGGAGSGGAGRLVGGAAGLWAIGLLMPQLAATETTVVGLEEGAFGGGELFETRGLGGGARLGGKALSFHPHEMDSLEVFLGELGWVNRLGRGVKVVVGGE
ncbi:hypothetical protein CBR_g56711 [Chara braunii]|uniref:Uncharacterized protein n=1 Tax=Chara braunii TaxID=69332 RepID=A0A388MDP5_CHABU|nr:hypothetical protein CBR_g56711 [Chara braunii]|eukprot:GBG92681.1 hypothetical protein CBR_g56711 [Chara braunii]